MLLQARGYLVLTGNCSWFGFDFVFLTLFGSAIIWFEMKANGVIDLGILQWKTGLAELMLDTMFDTGSSVVDRVFIFSMFSKGVVEDKSKKSFTKSLYKGILKPPQSNSIKLNWFSIAGISSGSDDKIELKL